MKLIKFYTIIFSLFAFSACSVSKKEDLNSDSNLSSTCIDSEEELCENPTSCSERLMINTKSSIEVIRNHSLSKSHCSIVHAVIVIHGRDRNPDNYFSYVMNAASGSGHAADTLVISPYFREPTDLREESDLYWDRDAGSASQFDWAMGGESYAPSSVSSYEVIDNIISSIGSSQSFPNLKSIVVIGHSAGGQLVQRYALTGNFNNQGLSETFFYVVANPSSYAYLNEQRPQSGSTTTFAVPDSTGCTSYNKWGYGLLTPNNYVGRLTNTQVINQYVTRNVTYLLGDSDTLTDGMDVTCYANFQGSSRYERGTAFFNFMNSFYPGHGHNKLIVPGVGHSGDAMINSTQGINALFPHL